MNIRRTGRILHIALGTIVTTFVLAGCSSPKVTAIDVTDTVWGGLDSNQEYWMITFRADGALEWTLLTDQVLVGDTELDAWTQEGATVHFSTVGGFNVWDGQIDGETMSGTSKYTTGAPRTFTLYLTTD